MEVEQFGRKCRIAGFACLVGVRRAVETPARHLSSRWQSLEQGSIQSIDVDVQRRQDRAVAEKRVGRFAQRSIRVRQWQQ